MNGDHWTARRIPNRSLIRSRLEEVIPEGTESRAWLVREIAASVVFVFLYAQAIEGITKHRIRPTLVVNMSDDQAARDDLNSRSAWHASSLRPGYRPKGTAWYRENTREPIRDETIRKLLEIGAAAEDQGLPTTSSKPRYWLRSNFADLFDPELKGTDLETAIETWRQAHLSPAALAFVALQDRMLDTGSRITIDLPSGERRVLEAGPSSLLAKNVIEVMLPSFFATPVVLAITEARLRTTYEARDVLQSVGVVPAPRLMPDIVAADLSFGGRQSTLALVFLELVATGGAMTAERVRAIATWLDAQGHRHTPALFGTVFAHRTEPVARQLAAEVAPGSFVWYATEPHSIALHIEGDDRARDQLPHTATTADHILDGLPG